MIVTVFFDEFIDAEKATFVPEVLFFLSSIRSSRSELVRVLPLLYFVTAVLNEIFIVLSTSTLFSPRFGVTEISSSSSVYLGAVLPLFVFIVEGFVS